MYTYENYIWGLVVYGVGALLLMPVIWKITSYVPWRHLRIPLRVLLLVILLTPITAYVDTHLLAPAWVVAGFELVQPTSEEGAVRALVPLALTFVLVLAAWYAATYGYSRWRPKAES